MENYNGHFINHNGYFINHNGDFINNIHIEHDKKKKKKNILK